MEDTSKYTNDPDVAHEDAVGGSVAHNLQQETQCGSVFPINALPPETIGEIFFWVIYDATPVNKIRVLVSGREDRKTIHAYFSGSLLVTFPRWLALSGKPPLDIAIYPYRWKKYYRNLGDWEIAMKKTFEYLSQALSRCKSFTIRSTDAYFDFLVPHGTTLHAPILEILDSQSLGYRPPQPMRMGILVCSALRRLRIAKFCHSCKALRIPQIETLLLFNHSAEMADNTIAICAIFASIPGVIPLKELTLHGLNVFTEDILPFSPRMPFVESLCNESNDISDIFLDALNFKNGIPYLLPKLKRL
ncbi:hypothetical protein M422DRAFT_241757 [Sphaerobolus stellatus SS14]|nr:hypothetical protein M422DRAFT_241757 [Sphaerobolus stellatus SS14]